MSRRGLEAHWEDHVGQGNGSTRFDEPVRAMLSLSIVEDALRTMRSCTLFSLPSCLLVPVHCSVDWGDRGEEEL